MSNKKELRELPTAKPFNLKDLALDDNTYFGSYNELNYIVYDENGNEVCLSEIVKKNGQFSFFVGNEHIGTFTFNGECFVCGDKKLYISPDNDKKEVLFKELSSYVDEINKSFKRIDELKVNYELTQKKLDKKVSEFNVKLGRYIDKYINVMTEEEMHELETLLNNLND